MTEKVHCQLQMWLNDLMFVAGLLRDASVTRNDKRRYAREMEYDDKIYIAFVVNGAYEH
jgi:hypothetical protein